MQNPHRTFRKFAAGCYLAVAAVIGNSGVAIADTLSTQQHQILEQYVDVWQVKSARQLRERSGGRESPSRSTRGRGASKLPEVEGLAGGDRNIYRIMTSAGRAAFDNMDPHELPTNNCRSSGLPTLAMVPKLQQWSLEGDVLTIFYEEFDTTRTVYLDGRVASGPATQLGHANGSVVDGVLEIRTTNLQASLGALSRNAPGSAERTVVEHYELINAGNRLQGNIQIEDPLFLTRTIDLSFTMSRAPQGTSIEIFPCDIEASQRYLD